MHCLGVKRRAVVVEASGQFGGKVLGICGATSVTAPKDTFAVFQRFDHDVGYILDTTHKCHIAQDVLFSSNALFDRTNYSVHVFNPSCVNSYRLTCPENLEVKAFSTAYRLVPGQ